MQIARPDDCVDNACTFLQIWSVAGAILDVTDTPNFPCLQIMTHTTEILARFGGCRVRRRLLFFWRLLVQSMEGNSFDSDRYAAFASAVRRIPWVGEPHCLEEISEERRTACECVLVLSYGQG